MSAIVGYNINPNGLSLYLDARNPTSYPGSGTTWYDLSAGGNNVSTGSMYYVSAGLTSSFSSSFPNNSTITSSIDFYAPNLTSIATIETVCRFNNYNWSTNSSHIFGWDSYAVGIFPSNGYVIFGDKSGAYRGLGLPNSGSSINGSSPIFGIWYYFVFEMNNGTTGPLDMFSNKMWVNGVQQNLVNANTPSLPNQNFNGGNGALAKYKSMTPQSGPGNNYSGMNDYAMFRVYNRTLSQAEITNSYNYYKPIFNLY